jgi:hypothetical protein
MQEVSHEGFDQNIPSRTLAPIGQLGISWGQLDSTLTTWIANESKGDLAVTYLLIGRMEVSQKFSRLADLFKLIGDKEKRAHVKQMRREIEPHQQRRNIIAHQFCLGVSKINTKELGFIGLQSPKRNDDGRFLLPITRLTVDQIRESAREAHRLMQAIGEQYIPPGDELPPSPLSGLPQ